MQYTFMRKLIPFSLTMKSWEISVIIIALVFLVMFFQYQQQKPFIQIFVLQENREFHSQFELKGAKEVLSLLMDNERDATRKTYFTSIKKTDSVFNQTGKQSGQCDAVTDTRRFDCYPDGLPTEKSCVARGCCWRPKQGVGNPLPLGEPWCYFPLDYQGYTVKEINQSSNGFSLTLVRNTTSFMPNDVLFLNMQVTFETDTRLRIKIFDGQKARYEVPLPNRPSPGNISSPLYNFGTSQKGQPFNFIVERKTITGLVPIKILDTYEAAPFVFADQFLQLSTYLPSKYIYGLGEHRGPLLHDVYWSRFTMWNKDKPPLEKSNLYGSHPFYLMMEPRGNAHGVFLLNSNAMDVILQPSPALTWRTIGGVLDMYVFLGPSPSEVIQQYTEVIGRSFMPPYWSLGYHLCRWGYKTANNTLEITKRVRNAGIPLDTQWNDIDYMSQKLDFTTGEKFGDQQAMVDTLHNMSMHYVVILDPGISNEQKGGEYPPYDIGSQMDIFIKDTNGKPLVGKVWPGNVVFPDFTNPSSVEYWTQMVKTFMDKVPVDGLWIDMNEISNFVAGSLSGCPKNNIEEPPYLPAVEGGSLRFSTICASAKQNLSNAYNVHNLYGMMETIATYQALLKARGKRPFIISRSTFAGQGHYGGHWSGDNFATYTDMHFSISEILNFNMFGISMIGADVCGFNGDTTEELCTRWHQLGSFYPFFRNHNSLLNKAQDPGAWSNQTQAIIRTAIQQRYLFLPYFYTLFHKSHGMGHTVVRPLFFEFPFDEETYGIDRQFMFGEALLISPVLEQGVREVNAYFPAGKWYDWPSGNLVTNSQAYNVLSAPLDKLNIHIRGGCIVPVQEPALTTSQSRKNPVSLLVALNSSGEAEGDLFWDDGESVDTMKTQTFNMLWFSAKQQTVQSVIVIKGYDKEKITLQKVLVYGVNPEPKAVILNGKMIDYYYDSDEKILLVPLNVDLWQSFTLKWE